jgi:two-component system sensor histidine kinase PilS (NtrC family)
VTDFEAHRELLAQPIRVTSDADVIRCRFQPEQLRQILFNLCDNCLQHGRTDTDTAVSITIRLARDADDKPVLDVVDNGLPIPQETLDDLFEPFYTTNHTGTGLGLYLARELCELNDSNLQYLRSEDGNCMRITLPPAPTE